MFVNSAGSQKIQESNCVFCSAAGAVNLCNGTATYTSENAASSTGSLQNAMSSATGKGQAARVIEFVEANTNRKATNLVETEIPLSEALEKMKSMPDKTVFVIHVSGKVHDDEGSKSHWLNALRVTSSAEAGLRFFDFQTNRELPKALKGAMHTDPSWVGARNPSSSTAPFIGIVEQGDLSSDKQRAIMTGKTPDPTAHRSMHRAVQRGTFVTKEATAVKVLAFPPA